ncbi:MAG TPA: outer membrane protein transport protein [Candidatus Paceibacterota bacterium]|nr:outer membrane protein transport protein [Candidatus Paceibacterota bacterium]
MKTFHSAGTFFPPGKKSPAAPLASAAFIFTLSVTPLWAEGFRNPPPGTFNLGRAGGRIAHVDDSSAIAQNPANLVSITNVDLQFTPTIVYIKVDYRSASNPGETASTKNPWKTLPNLFASAPFFDNRLALGLGITTPYGLSNEWDKKSSAFANASPTSLRYNSAHYSALTTVNFNPTLSVKAGEYLNLGVGIDVMWSQLTLKQFFPWGMVVPGAPDGNFRAKADGIGGGANFGATLHITEHQNFAITVRTPIKVNYGGHVSLDNYPAGGSLRDTFKSSIEFPTIVAAGYGIDLTDTIRLETDVEWLEFSNFKNLPLRSATAQALGVPSTVAENWKNTFTFGVGGDWKFAPGWVFRAGYQYYESPVPDTTFSPTIPDSDQNVITFGLGYTHGKHSLEGAYGLDFYNDRNINNDQNPALNGKYSMNVHLFSFSYRYSF